MVRRAVVALALAGLAGVALAALGHAVSPEHSHHAGSDSPAPYVMAAVALAAALAFRRAAGRRALALALVALLTVVAFEVALHSVHHVGEADDGASCPVLTATAHLSGVSAPDVDVRAPVQAPEYVGGVRLIWLLSVHPVSVPEGRAPPGSRSA
jgi:peptidoglycan/LPS O-acetylase OafA/YrhL